MINDIKSIVCGGMVRKDTDKGMCHVVNCSEKAFYYAKYKKSLCMFHKNIEYIHHLNKIRSKKRK